MLGATKSCSPGYEGWLKVKGPIRTGEEASGGSGGPSGAKSNEDVAAVLKSMSKAPAESAPAEGKGLTIVFIRT